MDAEMGTLASVAATAMVQHMTGSAWERIRTAVGDIWRRRHPERAEAVVSELAEAREEAALARSEGNEDIEQAIIDEWRARLGRLLTSDPSASALLRDLVEELTGPLASPGRQNSVTMNAIVSGQGRAFQSAGDMHITEG
ncbi:hypothetical protein ACIQ9P_03890 [Kitasatospora sp. NPDC094019]|uniref:hypothetical protein n=1 Tax=Kitasatospora sp. NPDC094019 TaxID=3364091 RepID=UPI0038160D64